MNQGQKLIGICSFTDNEERHEKHKAWFHALKSSHLVKTGKVSYMKTQRTSGEQTISAKSLQKREVGKAGANECRRGRWARRGEMNAEEGGGHGWGK